MRVLVDEIVILKTNKTKAATKVQTPKPVISDVKKPVLDNATFAIKTPKKTPVLNTNAITKIKSNQVEKIEAIAPKIEMPEKKTEKVYANVEVSNLKSAAYISKSASTLQETNSANKTDLIKISFSIDNNPNAKAEEKKYFIQVVNGSNKVLGRRITEFFDDRSITYSLSKTIQYENQAVQITQELIAEDFEKGTYTVNVYDRSRLVGKTTFTLK